MKKIRLKPVILKVPLFFLLVGFYTFFYSTSIQKTSDNIFWVRAVEEILSGNILLKGWVGGYYISPTSDFLWGALLRLFLSRKLTLFICGPISYTCLVFLAGRFVFQYYTGALRWWEKLLLMLPLIFPAKAMQYSQLNIGIHGITMMYTTGLLVLLNRLLHKSRLNKTDLIVYVAAIVFSGINDKWPLYFFVIPSVFVFIIEWALTYSRRHLPLLGASILAVVFSYVLIYATQLLDAIEIIKCPMKFSSADSIFADLGKTYSFFLRLFSADYSGKDLVSLKTVPVYISLLFVFLLVFLTILWFKREKEKDLIDWILIAGSVFCLGAFLFSALLKTTLYITPVFYFSVFFLIRRMRSAIFDLKWGNTAAYLCITLFALTSLPTNFSIHAIYNPHMVSVAKYLNRNNITTAYATFWESDLLWLDSRGEINTASILEEFGEIKGYRWVTRKENFEEPFLTNCIVVHKGDTFGITKELIEERIGEISSQKEFANYIVYILEDEFRVDLDN